MMALLWTLPLFPLAGFLVLALAGARLPRRAVAAVGVGSVGMSALLAASMALVFYGQEPLARVFREEMFDWFRVGGLEVDFALYLDELSMVMALVVTGVGFLIHLFSAPFMAEEADYSRYFAYLNLFVAAMLLLVLGDNLLVLFLGWEGVGLCSYLLIGYWHTEPANGYAARKAFVVTRLGDVALLLGIFLLFHRFGTLQIQPLLAAARGSWEPGSGTALLACLLILGGAVGKSAQLPLQTWLPDAMAGPSPVSALIHAATMVTAGVYLIARLHPLFELSSTAMLAVAAVGAATLLVAAFSALSQRDIKRILAYSTISQIGYMFLALGVGAWSAAIFHLVTHAFFKALLFLGAGLVIRHLHHEHDIFRMGGLRRAMPLTSAVFVIGAASLAALPLVTAGFYSKDQILIAVWHSDQAARLLWGAGMLGALLTGLYTFRLVFTVFGGEPVTKEPERQEWGVKVPVILLAALSIAGGWISLPLSQVFGDPAAHGQALMLASLAALVSLAGITLAWWLYGRRRASGETAGWPAWRCGLDCFQASGLGFDAVYGTLVERPLVAIARLNRRDLVEAGVLLVVWVNRSMHQLLSALQTGRVRDYALGLLAGALLLTGLGVWP